MKRNRGGDFSFVSLKVSSNLICLLFRDYYDPKSSIDVKQYRLKIWPGYKTSIRQHEYGPLMCVDQGFKILRTDTALDQMKQAYKQSPSNFKSAATKLLLGQIVITRYNNKTYKIDDIAWDRNIMEEFEVSCTHYLNPVVYLSL